MTDDETKEFDAQLTEIQLRAANPALSDAEIEQLVTAAAERAAGAPRKPTESSRKKTFQEMDVHERRQFIADMLGKPVGQLLALEFQRFERELLKQPQRDKQTADRSPPRQKRPYEIPAPLVVDGMHVDSAEWLALKPQDRIARMRRAMRAK